MKCEDFNDEKLLNYGTLKSTLVLLIWTTIEFLRSRMVK